MSIPRRASETACFLRDSKPQDVLNHNVAVYVGITMKQEVQFDLISRIISLSTQIEILPISSQKQFLVVKEEKLAVGNGKRFS